MGDEGRQPGNCGGRGPRCLPRTTAVASSTAAARQQQQHCGSVGNHSSIGCRGFNNNRSQGGYGGGSGRCDCSPIPGGVLQNDGGSGSYGDGGGHGSLHNSSHVGDRHLFPPLQYGCSATDASHPASSLRETGRPPWQLIDFPSAPRWLRAAPTCILQLSCRYPLLTLFTRFLPSQSFAL
jgi:hypothetical protein